MANCPLCNDTGKRMQANGQSGAYLGCSCTASTERADMHFAASKFITEYPLGGDNLDDDLAWFIHQRAKALSRAEALAELHPLWLAEKEWADKAEVRIAELEAKLAEVPRWISVKDRLPPLYKTVALLNDDRWMNTGNDEFDTNWYGAGWLSEFGQQFWSVIGETRSMTLDSVTHWMPLPAAPASEVM